MLTKFPDLAWLFMVAFTINNVKSPGVGHREWIGVGFKW